MTDYRVRAVASPPPEDHDWFLPAGIKWECCRKCGIVRRADDKNKPCRGPVTVGPREVAANDTEDGVVYPPPPAGPA